MAGLRVIVERAPEDRVWFVAVDGLLKFKPKQLQESLIANAKAEALAYVDEVLLDLRVAVGDVMR